MSKVLIRVDPEVTLTRGYALTQYLDKVGCPWTIGDAEDDIVIGWSDFYDYLSEDHTFKKTFFYTPDTHFLETTGRVVKVDELFPIRDASTFDLLYKVGDGSAIYNRNMSVLKVGGKVYPLKNEESMASAPPDIVSVLRERGLMEK